MLEFYFIINNWAFNSIKLSVFDAEITGLQLNLLEIIFYLMIRTQRSNFYFNNDSILLILILHLKLWCWKIFYDSNLSDLFLLRLSHPHIWFGFDSTLIILQTSKFKSNRRPVFFVSCLQFGKLFSLFGHLIVHSHCCPASQFSLLTTESR